MFRLLKKLLICAACFTITLASNVFAANITSYSFADIAGKVDGDSITVHVPYKTKTTYWDHKVEVDDGSTFRCGYLEPVDQKTTVGKITVVAKDGSGEKEYTVKIIKNDYREPELKLEKISGVTKNKAKVRFTYDPGDATIKSANACYYTGKKSSSPSKTAIKSTGETSVQLQSLKPDTKYYVYLEVVTEKRTYTTGSKTFRTDEDTKVTSSESANTSRPSTNDSHKGPNREPVQSNIAKNQWKDVNGKWYYFGPDGYALRNWFKVNEKWYYADPITNDLAMSGWRQLQDKWYYFDASGAMLANQWVYSEPSNAWYWMGDSGTMVRSQWIEVNGVKYLLAPDGKCLENMFICENGRFMYLKPNAQGLAKNERIMYRGHTYNTDVDGYVY